MTTTPLLRVEHLSKRLGDRIVLDDVGFDLDEGQVLAVVGPSGAGKSTLLQCLNHLLPIDRGRVLLRDELVGFTQTRDRLYPKRGRALAADRAAFGFVFQQFNLFPHRTALQNVTEALVTVGRTDRRSAAASAIEWLDLVGLADHADSYPNSLSGGQQQRVAIARALAYEPAVLLLDEPTSALDPELVGNVLGVIERVAALGVTMVIVTHELDFARDVSHRMLMLEHGRVVESGPTEHLFSPSASARTREYLRSATAPRSDRHTTGSRTT